MNGDSPGTSTPSSDPGRPDSVTVSSDEASLRRAARGLIETGRFPAQRPSGVWGGPGTGAPCAICEKPVHRDGLGFEVEFGPGAGAKVHYVHVRCFAAWEMECQEFLPARPDHGSISGRERDHTQERGSEP